MNGSTHPLPGRGLAVKGDHPDMFTLLAEVGHVAVML